MVRKRATGALEDEIMAYLWTTEAHATPSEVHAAVAPDLAYTTIMTVLTRLWSKGLLHRETRGRAYAYAPINSEAEHRAQAMRSTLDHSGDRDAVLSTFVESLSTRDVKRLRKLLAGDET